MMRRIVPILLLLVLLCGCAVTISDVGVIGRPDGPTSTITTDSTTQSSTCTISIRCDTLLDHMDSLSMGTASLVPEDGCLLAETLIELQPGDSVFDVLQRATERNDIQLEFSTSPLYDSKYIEGIGNLYEMDAGPLSGWTYSVNGVFPGYGTSQYTVSAGDVIEFLYTCDLGADVGNPAGALQ